MAHPAGSTVLLNVVPAITEFVHVLRQRLTPKSNHRRLMLLPLFIMFSIINRPTLSTRLQEAEIGCPQMSRSDSIVQICQIRC